MSGLFPNQLSSDGVDRLNHKWMVLLMLVLSLAAFIVPLHPSYRAPGHEESATATFVSPKYHDAKREDHKSSRLGVKCWCPSRFTHAMVDYANAKCRNSLTSAINGNNESDAYILPDDVLNFGDNNDVDDQYSVYSQFKNFTLKTQAQSREREIMLGDVRRVVTYQTPLLVLGTALMLVLPHALWCFLAECCCSTTNLALTLASASQACRNPRSNNPSLLPGPKGNCQSKPNTTSILYLVKKALSVIVVIALLLLINQRFVVEVQQIEKTLDHLSPATTTSQSPFIDDSDSAMQEESVTVKNAAIDFFQSPNDTFFCKFNIQQFSNILAYAIQCTVTVLEPIQERSSAAIVVEPLNSFTQYKNLLQFESAILCAVTSVLVICVVANVLSLCGWLYKLLSVSARNSVGLSGTVAMDTALLVHMARINCGPEVALRLAQDQAGE